MTQLLDEPATELAEKHFYKWFQNFREKHGGFKPDNVERWFKALEASKKKIRKFLDAETVTVEVDLVPGFDMETSKPEFNECLRQIENILPDYLNDYSLKPEDLVSDKIGKVKTNKHIMTYAKKKLKSYDYDYYKSILPKICSNLAAIKEKYSISKPEKVFITMSTKPEHFLSLGLLDCDKVSCFAPHKANDFNKFNLAISPNTYVILISSKPVDVDNILEEGANIKARCWGFASSDMEVFNFCNMYNNDPARYGKPLEMQAIIKLMEHLLKVDKVHFKDDIIRFSSTNLYLNPHPKWSFSSKPIDCKEQCLAVKVSNRA